MRTIRDVANRAGVSIATVSRVMNGDPTISVAPDTRERIFRAAEELHYRSRKRARGWVGTEKIKIGVVVLLEAEQESVRPHIQAVRRGVERELEAQGIGLHVIRRDAHIATGSGLDGLMIIGQNVPPQVYGDMDRGRVIFIGDCPDASLYNSVVMDYQMSVTLALDHLYQLGHHEIGFIGGPAAPREERLKHYTAYMKDKGLYNPGHMLLGDWWPENGYEGMKASIESGNYPSAFFVASDPLAIGAMSALHEKGLRIPEDVSIVSYDDVPTAAFLNPPLTTVRAYPELMGELAVDLFLKSFRGRTVPVKIIVPPVLIVRATTAPCMRPYIK